VRAFKPLLFAVMLIALFTTSGCGYIAHAIVHDAALHAEEHHHHPNDHQDYDSHHHGHRHR
jgi:hypothetical protein